MRNWNQKSLDQKKKQGTIRDYKISQRKNKPGAKASRPALVKNFTSPELDYIKWNLWYWCNQNSLELLEEHRFHPDRKWRFDFAIPALMIAIEFEGSIYNPNGDHRSVKGISRDIEKYKEAVKLDWQVLRYTCINYKELLTDLNDILCKKRNTA